MSFIPIGAAQINLKFTGPAVPLGAQVTYGVACGDGMAPEVVAQAQVNALTVSELLEHVSFQTAVTSVFVKKGPNVTGLMLDYSCNVPGLESEGAVPPNTAMLVKKVTPMGGRMNAGRLFFPALPKSVNDGTGSIAPSSVQVYQDYFDRWLDALADLGTPMILLHAKESTPGIPQSVMRLSVQGRLATQRRRLRG